jgi:predicted dehydrogenase
VPSRIAFSTLAFPDATLAAAVSAGRRWGYSGVELRLIDGELIDPAMSAERRAQVRRTLAVAGLPVVAVDSSIRLTGTDGTVIVEDGRIVRRAFGAQATAGDPGEDADPGAGAAGAAADPAAIEVASHAAQIADLLAAVEEGRAPAVDGQAGRDALEIVRAVYESARTGAPVGLTGS